MLPLATLTYVLPLPPCLITCSYIRQKHPYWDASGGGDHFYFALNDRGACALNSTHSELWAPIKLVHFGAFTGNASRDLSYNLPGRTHAGWVTGA